uniref:Uncharacterized protein n=1 Tax=Pectobacterium phage Taid TaxID=3158139 RepID=A0AB39AC61_9CAUD
MRFRIRSKRRSWSNLNNLRKVKMLASEKFPAEWKELNQSLLGCVKKSTENSFLCLVEHKGTSLTVCYYPKSRKIQFKNTIIPDATIHSLYCVVKHINETGSLANLVVENYPLLIPKDTNLIIGERIQEKKFSADDKKQRDIFAGLAMQLYLGDHLDGGEVNHRVVAEKSYGMADAMMKARGE